MWNLLRQTWKGTEAKRTTKQCKQEILIMLQVSHFLLYISLYFSMLHFSLFLFIFTKVKLTNFINNQEYNIYDNFMTTILEDSNIWLYVATLNQVRYRLSSYQTLPQSNCLKKQLLSSHELRPKPNFSSPRLCTTYKKDSMHCQSIFFAFLSFTIILSAKVLFQRPN